MFRVVQVFFNRHFIQGNPICILSKCMELMVNGDIVILCIVIVMFMDFRIQEHRVFNECPDPPQPA